MSTLNVYGITPDGYRQKIKLNYDVTTVDGENKITLSRPDTDKRGYECQNIYYQNFLFEGAGNFQSSDYISIGNWDIINSPNDYQFHNGDASYMYQNYLSAPDHFKGDLIIPDYITNASYMYSGLYNDYRCDCNVYCGKNVTDATHCFSDCFEMRAKVHMGANITHANYMYSGDYSIYGTPVIPKNIEYCHMTFLNCSSLSGEVDMTYCDHIVDCYGMFDRCRDIWIIAKAGTVSASLLLDPSSHLFSWDGTWRDGTATDSRGKYYYNTAWNDRVYII